MKVSKHALQRYREHYSYFGTKRKMRRHLERQGVPDNGVHRFVIKDDTIVTYVLKDYRQRRTWEYPE